MAHLSTLGPNKNWIGEVCDTLDKTCLTALVDNHWPTAELRVNLSFLKAGIEAIHCSCTRGLQYCQAHFPLAVFEKVLFLKIQNFGPSLKIGHSRTLGSWLFHENWSWNPIIVEFQNFNLVWKICLARFRHFLDPLLKVKHFSDCSESTQYCI